MAWWRTLDGWERTLLVVMVGGVALRLLHLGGDSLATDGAWYATMAESLVRHGEFVVPWEPDITYTHHFPPLYPAFLAIFFAPAGPSYLAIQLANLVAAGLFVAAAFFCTRDLYGRHAAFAVGAVAATLPTLVAFDREGLSETFVAMLFAVTIWAILKSLEKPRYIVLAGVFAGLGYLAKASMGPFFLLAGAAGFLWRFAYVRWAVFRDRWYLLAALIFATFVLPWAARNLLRHGWPHWETQLLASRALDALWAHPSWPVLVAMAFGWVCLILALQALPFLPGAAKRWREWRDERTSGLILAVLTPLLVAGFFVAAFSVYENYQIEYSPHPARYAITPIVPLLWLSMRHLDWSNGAPRGATRPTAGARIIRRADALATIGAGVIAGFLAFRQPYFSTQGPLDIIILAMGVAGGLAIIGVSRLSSWEPVVREKPGGEIEWRAVRRKLRGWTPWLGVLLFVAAWFGSRDMIVLILAASAAAIAATWRHRALVVAIIFLGHGLGGAVEGQPFDLVGEALEELREPGDTVASQPDIATMMWPFVPEEMDMVPWGSNASFVVTMEAAPPDGYELVDGYTKFPAVAPAGWLRWRIKAALDGTQLSAPPPHVFLHRIAAPAS